MELDKKLSLLKRIAEKFNEAKLTWALGASMMLFFNQLISDFHDIDIMLSLEDADKAKEILQEMGTLLPPNPDEKYKTKRFMEFIIDEIEVDVIAGFAIVCNGETVDCSLKKEQIVKTYDLQGVQIPLQSMELWCKYYEMMGREKKVAMIKGYLEGV